MNENKRKFKIFLTQLGMDRNTDSQITKARKTIDWVKGTE